MTKPTKEQLEEYISNNKLDVDESYPRSDWWKFKQQRDEYKQQRDELINDIAKLRERSAELEKKAKAWDNYSESVKEDLVNEFGKGDKRVQLGMELNNNIYTEEQND